MEDPDFSFWACTQAITDSPDDGPSSRENPTKVDYVSNCFFSPPCLHNVRNLLSAVVMFGRVKH